VSADTVSEKENAMRTLMAVMVLALMACADEQTPGSLIERTRVLGAEVHVESDATRVWPMPGESLAVRWVVTQPDQPEPLRWSFALCLAGDCAAPLAVYTGTGVPELVVQVPSSAVLGEVKQLLLVGTVESSQRDDVALTIDVAVGGIETANHVPALMGDAVTLNGAVWPAAATEPAMTGCALGVEAADVPRLRVVAGDAVITVATRESDRERFIEQLPGGEPTAKREALQVSSFTTGGELERQFSIIEGDADVSSPVSDLDWTPPAADEVPADGLRVRFTLVLRDGRGGLDSTTRVDCLVP
jgi:hypothetical protein